MLDGIGRASGTRRLRRRAPALGALAAFALCGPLAGRAFAQQGPSEQAGEQMDPTRIEEAIAAAEDGANVRTGEVDPWIGFNREMFAVHNFFDRSLLVPISLAYRHATPARGRKGLRRFLANLRAPTVIVNDLLQGEFGRAGDTAGRFLINSTLGAGGFADPASLMGVTGHREDFGQTLAVWGAPSGPYLFLPLVGPSTVRDVVGTGVQILFDPLFYVRTPTANTARVTRAGAGGISAREPFIEPLDEMRANSLDYYVSFRSFYLQNRARQILNDRTDIDVRAGDDDAVDPFEAEFDALDDALEEAIDDDPVGRPVTDQD